MVARFVRDPHLFLPSLARFTKLLLDSYDGTIFWNIY